ncbi:MAG: dihydrofolate reductase family protein [Ignavibacteria bacterium]
MRKVIVYIAMNLDGYIAGEGDDLSFLSIVQQDGEDYGYHAFKDTIDTVIIGRKTYDWVCKQGIIPHQDKLLYIITRNPQLSEISSQYYSGDLSELMKRLHSESGKDIYCDGGAELIDSLLSMKMIDECIISIIPTILGGGTPLFRNHHDIQFKLLNSTSFASGLVQVHYALKYPNIVSS